ncbi:hypothetical protein ABVK25_006849 [Lepraria finkii]|uniref:Uncharacterized protein n=1 Tax=Lepraria finkii TaxID=1340010 RepID=A0ABR4B7S5_9LECA
MKKLPTLSFALLVPQVTAAPGLWVWFWQREMEEGPPTPDTLPSPFILTGLYTNYPTNTANFPTNTAYGAYPTASATASATGSPPTANYTGLSITLPYQTILTTQAISSPSIAPATSLGGQCPPGKILCNSATTFSLCIGASSDASYGYFFFMGAVAVSIMWWNLWRCS